MQAAGKLYGHGAGCSWMMESGWEHPIHSLRICSGGTLGRDIGELAKSSQFPERSEDTWCFSQWILI